MKQKEFQMVLEASEKAKEKAKSNVKSDVLSRFVMIRSSTHEDCVKTLSKQRNTIIHIATKQTLIVVWYIVITIAGFMIPTTIKPLNSTIQLFTYLVAVGQASLLYLMFRFGDALYIRLCSNQQQYCIRLFEKQETVQKVDETLEESSASLNKKNNRTNIKKVVLSPEK